MLQQVDKNVRNFFASKVKGVGKELRNIIVINQFNSFNIPSEMVYENLKKVGCDTYVYYHQFSDEGVDNAYEPFIQYIRANIEELKLDIDEILSECQVINMQIPLFKSVLTSDVIRKAEFSIYNEIDFERNEFENSLIAIIKYVASKKPTMFILNRLHMAGGTTVKLINELVVNSVPEIAIFASIDNTYRIADYMRDIWNTFISTLTEYELLIEWSGGKEVQGDTTSFDTSVEKLPEYYTILNNLKAVFAFDQAYHYIAPISRSLALNKDKVDIQLKYGFYGIFAVVCVFRGKSANAIFYCNEINLLKNDPACDEEMSNKIDFYYNFVMGYAQMYNEQEKDARASAKKAIEAAEKSGHEERIFCGELLEHMARFSGWKDNVWLGDSDYEHDLKLLEKAEKFGFINHLAHIHVYGFDNDIELYKNKRNLEQRISHWKKGIDIAKELNNDKFGLDACRKAIMLASVSGFYDVSNYIYMTYSMPIIMQANNRFEEANVYNGLGFNKCMEGNYIVANDYFNKALNIFVEIKRYDFVCETLYNMAINCICAKDYENGDIYVSASMRILKCLKSDMMRVCHISKLNGMKALCTFMNGNMYTAEEYLRKAALYLYSIIDIKVSDPYVKYWRDDVFLYNYVRMCIEYESGDIEAMDSYWVRLSELIEGGGTFKHLMLGATDKENFIKLYEKEKEHIKKSDKLLTEKYTIRRILNSCQSVTSKIECERVKNDMEFFTTWKQLVRKFDKNKYLLVENACVSMKNNYNVDNCIVIEYTHGEPSVLFNSGEYLPMDSAKRIAGYFKNNPVEFFTSKFDRSFEAYREIISLFDIKSIANFCGFPHFNGDELDMVVITYTKIRNTWNKQENRISMDENNVQFMNVIFNEMIDAIDRVNDKVALEANMLLEADNEKLKKIANCDRLTGLYNRHGFYSAIEEYVETEKKDICVAFIDLDNFKYYNDHFGHDIGDVVLKKIADIMNKVSGENDIVVRYGGDEFLMIFDEASCENTEIKVKRIYDELEKNNHFIDLIVELTGKKVIIPEAYKISFSAGISKVEAVDNLSKGINEAIARADNALYYIKRTTKKQCIIWDNIKDQIK